MAATTKSLQDRAERAALRKQAAKDELDALLTERATKRVQALESRIDPDDTNNNRRRAAKVELKGEDERLSLRKRSKAANVGRELHRQSARWRTFENQISVNVVGTGPKVVFHWNDKDAASTVGDWFNEVWAPDCDQRDDNHLADFADIVVNTVVREGEVLCVFDDWQLNDGRLRFYSVDQLPTVDEKKWKTFALNPQNGNLFVELDGDRQPLTDENGEKIPLKVMQGRVTNRFGRVVYYIADEQYGRTDVDPNDDSVAFLSRKIAKLIKKPWRVNQLIGQSDALPVAGEIEDLDAMRAAEIASARRNSERAYAVKGRNAYENALARKGLDVDDLIEDAGGDPAPGDQEDQNLHRLEQYADGYVDYIGEEEEIIELGQNRPNIDVSTFGDDTAGVAGAALGLARFYATLKASSSYTAFRGEMLATWGSFARMQKWLERRFLDWVCMKAVSWAVRTGALKITLPDGWERTYSWILPQMPEVDEGRSSKAKATKLKNAMVDYAEILGPQWEKKLRAFAKQLDVIRELMLPLEILETKAGAPAQQPPGDGNG